MDPARIEKNLAVPFISRSKEGRGGHDHLNAVPRITQEYLHLVFACRHGAPRFLPQPTPSLTVEEPTNHPSGYGPDFDFADNIHHLSKSTDATLGAQHEELFFHSAFEKVGAASTGPARRPLKPLYFLVDPGPSWALQR